MKCHKGYKLAKNQYSCVPDCDALNCNKCPDGLCIACSTGYSLNTTDHNCYKNTCTA